MLRWDIRTTWKKVVTKGLYPQCQYSPVWLAVGCISEADNVISSDPLFVHRNSYANGLVAIPPVARTVYQQCLTVANLKRLDDSEIGGLIVGKSGCPAKSPGGALVCCGVHCPRIGSPWRWTYRPTCTRGRSFAAGIVPGHVVDVARIGDVSPSTKASLGKPVQFRFPGLHYADGQAPGQWAQPC